MHENTTQALFKIKLDEEVGLIFFIEHTLNWTKSELKIKLQSVKTQKILDRFIIDNKDIILLAADSIIDPKQRTDLIWSIYSKKINLSTKKEHRALNLLITKFTPVFHIIWNSELVKMSEYKDVFNQQFTEKHNDFIKKIHTFLQSTYNLHTQIYVYMLPCSNLTIAKTHKDHNIILTQHSGCIKKQPATLIALMHEYIHILQHHSASDNMLKKAFTSKKILHKLSSIENPPSLSYAAREILVHSIASALSPSYYASIFPHESYFMHDISYYESELFNNESNNYNQWYEYFRIIAYHTQNMLDDYMTTGKKIDQEYCDNLAKIMVDYVNKI